MRFFYSLVLFIFTAATAFASDALVLVSVSPYVEIVQALAGPDVRVELMVPTGFSSHTYEPTPKQVIQASKAKIWFTIGELFEIKATDAIRNQNPAFVVVDLRSGLHLLHEGCDHHHGADPHIWMSPKMMQVQVAHIAEALVTAFPESAGTTRASAIQLIQKLQTLDDELKTILAKERGKKIFVSHPAYGYFCEEFGLTQIPIEFEGKDPTPRKITMLIQEAKEAKTKVIFAQKQYSSKAAELVANEIGAKIVLLDPYAEDYFESMRHIAKSFATEATG